MAHLVKGPPDESPMSGHKKPYKNLCLGVVQGLEQVFTHGRFSDKVILFLFKNNSKWGGRDRRFVAESLYDCVRWWRRLLFALEISWNEDWLNMNDSRAHQRPFHFPFDLSDYWKVMGAYLCIKGWELPNWPEFQSIEVESVQKYWDSAPFVVMASLPDWLDEVGRKELGRAWEEEVPFLNKSAPVYLRTNLLKIKKEELLRKLEQEGYSVEAVKGHSEALLLTQRANVFKSRAFQQGFFEMQDLGSQQVAPLLAPLPGERIVDACAGAGGKALHMASIMGNKGKILALDIHAWKLKELARRCARSGVDIVETKLIESTKTMKRLKASADALLLDVPCSGSGVLRRNPDAKWKLTYQQLSELHELQRSLLTEYSKIVKNGGRMVYATCSLLPSENAQQVEWFLAHHRGWSLEGELKLLPSELNCDGFYAARLKKD